MTAASRLCLVAAVAFGVIAGIGLGKRSATPPPSSLSWSAGR